MQDGSSIYYPMVKMHWWSPYKLLHSYQDCVPKCFYNIKHAKKAIKNFHEEKLENMLDHIYYIPYKEEELWNYDK